MKLTSLHDLTTLAADTIIDARAPSEFAEDHLPGAINLPVLSDAQRAEIGTIYKQQSPFTARKRGAALVAQNVAQHLLGPLSDKPGDWQPLVYCWRGGQRSGSFATILRQIGWRVAVLDGGYKSYRRLVQAQLYDTPFPAPVLLLDGGTGTAKTEILARVARLGGQVIDLEALAAHRGSLFGAEAEQPSQKLFETRLAQAMVGLDPARPVLVEAESNRIGSLRLPPALWHAMRSAARVRISAPLAARVAHILHAYSEFCADPARLSGTLSRLQPYHSKDRLAQWHQAADQGRFSELVADLILQHYDPGYARTQRDRDVITEIALPDLSEKSQETAAERLNILMQCRESETLQAPKVSPR